MLLLIGKEWASKWDREVLFTKLIMLLTCKVQQVISSVHQKNMSASNSDLDYTITSRYHNHSQFYVSQAQF